MEKEKIEFQIEKDALSNDLKIFVRDNVIYKALKELKRKDKSNLAIIEDTIKILEEPFTIDARQIEAGAIADLAAPLKCEPVGRPAMPNSVVNGKVVLPDIKIDVTEKDIIGKGMSDMFRGGMF